MKYILFIISFFLLITSPIIDDIFNIDQTKSLEKRQLATFPTFDVPIDSIPKGINSYLDDNFGFRNLFVKTNALLKYHLFNSVNNENVMMGKSNFLFLRKDFAEGVDYIYGDYTNTNLKSDFELKVLAKSYIQRTRFLKSRGIDYYSILLPNKHTVYSEFLPFQAKMCRVDTISKMDQEISFLKKHRVSILDPREMLKREAKQNLLYIKEDTHWNEYGAFLTTQFLLEEINKKHREVPRMKLSDYYLLWLSDVHTWKEEYKEDWCKNGCLDIYYVGSDKQFYCPQGLFSAIGFNTNRFLDSLPIFKPKSRLKPIKSFQSDNISVKKKIIFTCDMAPSDKVVLVFRDSYGDCMIKFLIDKFRKVIFLKEQYNDRAVNVYNPDLVIDAHVERLFR